MAMITEWVRNIFIMVAAISFVEIILPSGTMSKYVKFIFSLMILAVVIYPLGNLKEQDSLAALEPMPTAPGQSVESPQDGSSGQGTPQEGETDAQDQALQNEIAMTQTKQIEEVYKEKLSSEIKDFIITQFSGISTVSSEIYMNKETNQKNFGEIRQVVIKIDNLEYKDEVKTLVSQKFQISKSKISVEGG